MIRVLLFDRFDAPIGELKPDEVLVITRHEAVNGEHSLEITTTCVLEKGWRILTRDARGKWREHVVYGTDAAHEAGERVLGTYYCTWSVQHDLMGTRTSRMPGVQNPVTASIALGYAIEGTARWQKGTVTNTATAGASMYDMDGWEAVSVLVENWGGEVDATIEVIGDEITTRKVDLYSAQGDQDAKRRFDFGADLKSVHRRIADGPLYCRITPRGKGEQTDDGYGRKVRITSVNQGKDYLENSAMVDLAKLPDGNGGWEYPTLEVENSNCETPEQLKEWALTVLDEYTTPNVSYEVDVLQAAAEGIDMQGVSLGDSVQIVDRKFGDGLRLTGRVLEMSVNMLDERDAKLVIGNVDKGIVQVFGDLKARLDMVSKTVWNMNGGTYSTAEYLSELIARINTDINATGGYTYITEGEGLRTYDVAVTDPLVGTEASAVVEIKGGTIRIANSRTAQGAWEWKTVFTSGHIAANLVTAAQITTGYIGSAGDTFIDLDNHTAQLGQTAGPHVIVDSSGVNIYDGATDVGFFGEDSSSSVIRIGDASSGNVLIDSSGSIDIRNGSTSFTHFGYDSSGHYIYTLGSRDPDYTIGINTYVLGDSCAASGRNAFASGYFSRAMTEESHAEGYFTLADGLGAHSEGSNTEATADASHAEGSNCKASGIRSHAEGDHSEAKWASSHAEGYYTTANNYYAHSEGNNTTASGHSSHAEGSGTTSSGNYSHAEGYHTTAHGECSHATGLYTTAYYNEQTVCGQYNSNSSNNVFEVGNGTSLSSRSNAFHVTWGGSAYAGSTQLSSDRRVKTPLGTIGQDEAANFIRSLVPSKFEKFGRKELGFYAQDVEETDFGEYLVDQVENYGYEDFRCLDYNGLIAPLVKYAQSLEERIERLEERLGEQ